jgi:hypothetical protein
LETLTVVIEVKGCWHVQVRSAVEQQLVNDYLRPNGLTHGIYLVGWFVCPQWEKSTNHLIAQTLNTAQIEVAEIAAKFDGKTSPEKVKGFILDCRYPT